MSHKRFSLFDGGHRGAYELWTCDLLWPASLGYQSTLCLPCKLSSVFLYLIFHKLCSRVKTRAAGNSRTVPYVPEALNGLEALFPSESRFRMLTTRCGRLLPRLLNCADLAPGDFMESWWIDFHYSSLQSSVWPFMTALRSFLPRVLWPWRSLL